LFLLNVFTFFVIDFGRMSFMDMNFDMRNRLLTQKYSKNLFDEDPSVKIKSNQRSSSKQIQQPIYDNHTNGRSLDNINKINHSNSPVVDLNQPPVMASHVRNSSSDKKQHTTRHVPKMTNLVADQRKTDDYLLRVKKESEKLASKRASGMPVKGVRSTSAVPFNYPFLVTSAHTNPLNEINQNVVERQQQYHHQHHPATVVVNKPTTHKQSNRLQFPAHVLLPQPPHPAQHHASQRINQPMYPNSMPASNSFGHASSEHYSSSGQFSSQNQQQKFVYFICDCVFCNMIKNGIFISKKT
jgi:hypothetical protein